MTHIYTNVKRLCLLSKLCCFQCKILSNVGQLRTGLGNWGKEETGMVLRGGDHHVDGLAS